MGSLYNKVRVNNPGHSFFNMSFDKKFDCDMGQLIPIVTKFCMPNEVIKYGNEIVARMNPLVAPVMHEINVYTQYYFVPLRILFGYMKSHVFPTPTGNKTVKEWEVNDHDLETFLTGGRTGYDTSISLPFFDSPTSSALLKFNDNYVHPVVYNSTTSEYSNCIKIVYDASKPPLLRAGRTYIYRTSGNTDATVFVSHDRYMIASDHTPLFTPIYENEVCNATGLYSLHDYLGFPVGISPTNNGRKWSRFPTMAYNMVWNNFFRDENLMDEVDVSESRVVKNVCWNKDYFTSAYTELQRGQAPAISLSGTIPVSFGQTTVPVRSHNDGSPIIGTQLYGTVGSSAVGRNFDTSSDTDPTHIPVVADLSSVSAQATADVSASFSVNDLRVALRIQEWLETNLRVGVHLNEHLIGHFGVGPRDETLQRPVYLGGSKSPVIVSEVLQTSSTDTTSPQGNMAGHGITADRNFIGSYHTKEFGVFIGVMYIRPKANYQQGIDREWLYETKYDLPYPEFAHLGNQAIFRQEIFADDATDPMHVFGYTERFNELRSSHSVVCGGMRSIFDFWHVGRTFKDIPELNADFVRCVPSKRIFAVQSEPGFVVNVGNVLHCYKPLPVHGDPRT